MMKKRYHLLVGRVDISVGGELPEWYTIFREGPGELEGGERYTVSKEAYNNVIARINRRGNEIVFDYEHQTLADGEAPASGWIKDWRWVDGVGIQAKVAWTERAAEYLKNREYRYFSPVFYVSKSTGLLVAVHSVALTNAPKTNQLQPLLAKLGAEPEEENAMLSKLLIASLGLNEDATDEVIVAAVRALMEKEKADPEKKEVIAKAVVDALGAESDDESTVVASIHALKQQGKNTVSLAEFNALKEKLAGQDAEKVVAKAIAEGKITPDQKEWATTYAKGDIDGFNTFVAKAPVVIPVKDLPKGEATPTAVIDETVLQVASMMDVDKEDLKTYGGLQ